MNTTSTYLSQYTLKGLAACRRCFLVERALTKLQCFVPSVPLPPFSAELSERPRARPHFLHVSVKTNIPLLIILYLNLGNSSYRKT